MTHPIYSLKGPATKKIKAQIPITGSKSETNRLLLLKALYPQLNLSNPSNSDDAIAMQKGVATQNGTVDVHHAGTAMRFLTAFFATQSGAQVTLTGSHRMQERPIGILVSALNNLGAEISYTKEKGYPPLRITGKKITKSEVHLQAGVSSQYISALLLVGPQLENGLTLYLEGKITSVPYIRMTLSLLEQIGVKTQFKDQVIRVWPMADATPATLVVESDWSAASYYYSILALSEIGSSVRLSAYKPESLQGDAVLSQIYVHFGVSTLFKNNEVVLEKVSAPTPTVKAQGFSWDLANAPDIAQTIAVTCFGLGLKCDLTGLHTLKIKETDRLVALENELSALGAHIVITPASLHIQPFNGVMAKGVTIATYHDHRMAMAFAPLALKTELNIADPAVVHKSYPDFWAAMEQLGFRITKM